MKAKKQSAAEKYQPRDYWTDRIRKAIALDEEIKELKAELDEIKEEVKGYFGEHKSESRLVTPAGAAILKVANSYSVLPEWVPELKKIYKDDFGVFVEEKVKWSPTTALRRLLADADYKYADVIREAVEITTTYSVQFEKAVVKIR